MTDTTPLGLIVVRLKVPVKNMPVGTELGYKDVPDAIAALGSAAFFDVVRDQQGNPIPPLTPEEIEAAQRAAQRRAKSRRLILGADFDPLWDRVEGIPSAEELTDMQAAVDAVADVPPRVEALESGLPSMVADALADDRTIRDAATAAAEQAMLDKDLLEGGDIIEEDIAFAVVDEDGRRTWIEAGVDGGPTAYAAGKIGAPVEMDTAVTELAFSVVDEDERRTWIEVDGHGRPSAYARTLLAEALASGPNIACYGASGTEGQTGPGTSYPEQLQALLPDRIVTNLGVGGDTSSDIAARQGGNPYLLLPTGGNIPASGSVTVTVTVESGGSLDLIGNTWTGTLAGVRGRFSTNASGVSSFIRSVDGDAVPITKPTPFYTDLGEKHRGDIHILWVGGNNAAEIDIVEGDLNAMIHRMGRAEKRFLVIGPLTSESNGVGTPVHDAAVELETRFFRTYGRRYVNLRRYLIDHGLADAGITPTEGDLEDIENDVHPRSLRTDAIHLTATANGLIASLLADRLREMGWV